MTPSPEAGLEELKRSIIKASAFACKIFHLKNHTCRENLVAINILKHKHPANDENSKQSVQKVQQYRLTAVGKKK